MASFAQRDPPKGIQAAGRGPSRWARFLAAVSLLGLLAAPEATLAQSARAPIIALPQDATGGTDDYYYLDLGSGVLTRVDQLRRDPVGVRVQRLAQNVFQNIGRPTSQPAADGEILLEPIHTAPRNARAALFVETSTGYVAYYDQLGKGGNFGEITTVIGRPFAPLAATDGNFALLMRHDGNGRTVGAFLYHAGSGRGFYLPRLNKLEIDATAATADGFPPLTGHVAAAELQSSERTTGYLVADAADGSLRFLDLSGTNVSVRDASIGLYPTFAADAAEPAARRFTAAPIRNSSETTTHVLFVDIATGELAALEDVEAPGRRPVLRKLAADLYAVLGTAADAGWRTIAAVPGVGSSGATRGIWLIDSLTRRAAFVQGAETPGSATVRRVRSGN